jgi:hypothetical protein
MRAVRLADGAGFIGSDLSRYVLGLASILPLSDKDARLCCLNNLLGEFLLRCAAA